MFHICLLLYSFPFVSFCFKILYDTHIFIIKILKKFFNLKITMCFSFIIVQLSLSKEKKKSSNTRLNILGCWCYHVHDIHKPTVQESEKNSSHSSCQSHPQQRKMAANFLSLQALDLNIVV